MLCEAPRWLMWLLLASCRPAAGQGPLRAAQRRPRFLGVSEAATAAGGAVQRSHDRGGRDRCRPSVLQSMQPPASKSMISTTIMPKLMSRQERGAVMSCKGYMAS